jgi:hypothetical protein
MTLPRIKRLKVQVNWPDFATRVEQKAGEAVFFAMVRGASEAAALTPIATGTLINSRTLEVRREGTQVVGRASYLASYAAAVHDPDNPQRFRRESAEKEFMVKGFERARPHIDAMMLKTFAQLAKAGRKARR